MFEPLAPVLIYLLTAGVKEFVEKVLKRTFDAKWSAAVAAAVAALVLFANGIGALLPQTALPIVGQIVTLVVTLAAAFGVHATVKSFAR